MASGTKRRSPSLTPVRQAPERDHLAVLRRTLHSGAWVALDIETTDLGPNAELVEIAIVSPQGTTYETLVRPQGKISKAAAQVHRIAPTSLTFAPSFREIAAHVQQRLARRTVLGYNVDFDRQVLWRELTRAGQPAPICGWLCLCDLMTRWSGRRMSLDRALEQLGVGAVAVRHRAAGDARAVAALARALAALAPALVD